MLSVVLVPVIKNKCGKINDSDIGRRGGGVIFQAYEIKLESEADYDEAVWCKIVS